MGLFQSSQVQQKLMRGLKEKRKIKAYVDDEETGDMIQQEEQKVRLVYHEDREIWDSILRQSLPPITMGSRQMRGAILNLNHLYNQLLLVKARGGCLRDEYVAFDEYVSAIDDLREDIKIRIMYENEPLGRLGSYLFDMPRYAKQLESILAILPKHRFVRLQGSAVFDAGNGVSEPV